MGSEGDPFPCILGHCHVGGHLVRPRCPIMIKFCIYIYFRALIMYSLFNFSYAIQKSFMEIQGSNFDMACGIYIAIITKNLHIHQKLWCFPLWVSFDTWNIPKVKFVKTPSFKIDFIIILFSQKQLHQLSIQSQLSFGHHNVPNYNTWMVHKSPFLIFSSILIFYAYFPYCKYRSPSLSF